jgi:hypothetical protein
MSAIPTGIPPRSVTTILRLEGAAVFVAALIAFYVTGGNWWLFALLILAPDLSMLGALGGKHTSALSYNLAHTYVAPALLAVLGWASGQPWLIQVVLIWAAHIGIDRALGYGLKYGSFHVTHLGVMGKKRDADALADAS